MTEDEAVRVCVLLNGETIHRYAATSIVRMVNETAGTVSLVVVNTAEQGVTEDDTATVVDWLRSALDLIRRHGFWSPVVLKNALFPPRYAEHVTIETVAPLAAADRIETAPQPTDGIGNELPSAVVEMVGEKADVVVRFGFGILQGDILTTPEYGVLSFHHGDIRRYRGRAGGFWAYLNGDDTAGVTLQQLTPTLDGGKIAVYEPVDITDAHTLAAVKSRLFLRSEEMLVTAIERIEDGTFDPTEPETLGELYTERRLPHVAHFYIKTALGRIRSIAGQSGL